MGFSFGLNKKKSPIKVSYLDTGCQNALTDYLSTYFTEIPIDREIIFFCVGTDRSTGDSLGPLVGSKLSRKRKGSYTVMGTLDEPVHAVNMNDNLTYINENFQKPFIIAIDACLGQISSVGCIQIGQGPIKPGAGVQKDLPPVGDMHITGIVNVSGFMEYFVLQNTRLSQVMNMAEKITESIYYALIHSNRHRARNDVIPTTNPITTSTASAAAGLSKFFLKSE